MTPIGFFLNDATCQIFVVDDDDSVRNSLMRLLKSAGYAVAAFASAESFLREVPSQAHGCVVIDVHMPGMSGIELQAIIVAQKRDLAVIMITAYEDVQTRRAAMEAGAIAFLLKPFDDHMLTDAVSRVLGPKVGSSD